MLLFKSLIVYLENGNFRPEIPKCSGLRIIGLISSNSCYYFNLFVYLKTDIFGYWK